MSVLGLSAGVILVVIALLVVPALRGKGGDTSLREIGTLIDRAISSYRRALVPLLLVSLLCLPLGGAGSLGYFVSITALLGVNSLGFNDGIDTLGLALVISALGTLGIGTTLLACATARMLDVRAAGGPGSLGDALPRGQWRAVLGLTAVLIPVTLVANVLGILGALLGLFWVLAPAVLIVEGRGPFESLRRGAKLARRNYGALLGTLVSLYLIGWLAAGTPLFGGIALLNAARLLPEPLVDPLLLASWMLSTVFVAPLLAVGAYVLYRHARERELDATPPPFFPPE
jgi:hypothetical protein